jgi:hypothetical protein
VGCRLLRVPSPVLRVEKVDLHYVVERAVAGEIKLRLMTAEDKHERILTKVLRTHGTPSHVGAIRTAETGDFPDGVVVPVAARHVIRELTGDGSGLVVAVGLEATVGLLVAQPSNVKASTIAGRPGAIASHPYSVKVARGRGFSNGPLSAANTVRIQFP